MSTEEDEQAMPPSTGEMSSSSTPDEVPPSSPQQQPAAPKTTAPSNSAAARRRAQARRRRILEQGKDRMDSVNGTPVAADEAATIPAVESDGAVVPTTDTTTGTVAADTGAEGELIDGGDGAATDGGEAEGGTATSTAPVAATLTGAQRLAQARRRRYKRSATATTAAGSTSSPPVEDGDVAADASMAATDAELPSTAAVDNEPTAPVVSAAPVVPPEKTVTAKRRYIGIAKMQRKKLAEKKASEDNLQHTAFTDAKKNRVKSSVSIPLAPILFQLITVLALFFAGLDVGLQNHYMGSYQTIDASGGPNVIRSLSFMDNGYGILSTLGLHHRTTTITSLQDVATAAATTNMMHPEEVIILDSDEEDEFQSTTKPLGATTTRQPNIDPIFNVDLDELTLNKTGFLMFLFRLAVRFHRSLTYFLYLLPKSFLQGIWSYTPFSSSSTTATVNAVGGVVLPSRRPVFAICAVVIRYVGKRAFGDPEAIIDLEKVLEMRLEVETGAGIALVAEDKGSVGGINSKLTEGKGELKGLVNLDLIGMGKDYAMKFVDGNFPMVIVLYRLIQHVKYDMYVMMCGFFLGLVLPVGLSVGVVKEGGTGLEEL